MEKRPQGAGMGAEYVTDWQAVSAGRYAEAQKTEREYWSQEDAAALTLQAQYYFYAGYYEWTKKRALLNPFKVKPDRPDNFQVPSNEIEGTDILDIGCGPMSHTISLVHCARVHVIDPLILLYRQIQPFGWKFFSSISSAGGEQLPFDSQSFHFVHCWNVLDHTKDAARPLDEIVRVLRPGGQLLLGCDARGDRGGGPAHPYLWSIGALESGIFDRFKPITEVALWDHERNTLISRADSEARIIRWICRLQKTADA